MKRRSLHWLLRVLSVLAVVSLLAAACGGSDGTEVQAAAAEPTQESAPAPTDAPATGPTEVPVPVQTPTVEPTPEPAAEPSPAPTPEITAPDNIGEIDLASGCGSGAGPGITTETFQFQGIDRIYEQVVPASYDDLSSMPVVLNWHGLGSNGPEQLGFSDYVPLAEAEGFIVIAPTGLPGPGDTRNSWEPLNLDADRDDVAFANAVLDRVITTLCVDQRRVYATGMANGGYFSAVLACEMSDRIAAAASVAGLVHADDCQPTRPVPFIGFHGTDDEVVPYNGGGISSLAPDQVLPLFELKIKDEFAEFAATAGCDVDPIEVRYSVNVRSIDYVGCDDAIRLTFYEIRGAGHTWPGSAFSLALSESLGFGVTTAEISASEVSWDFFSQQSLDR